MMFRRPVLLSWLCACAISLALSAGRCPAQQEFKKGELPDEGTSTLEGKVHDERNLLRDLSDGKIEAGKEHEAAIDLLAKWYTYRLTWVSDVQNKTGAITLLFAELDKDLPAVPRNETTQSFRQMFAKALAKNARDVLQNRTPIARVNAARVLWQAAPTREPEVANVCLEVIQNPAHNGGTKLWAFKALQQFLAPNERMPPPPFKDKDQAILDRIALACIAYIDHKQPVDGLPEGEVDGLRYVRREAIRALGLTVHPAVVKDGKLVGRTAQVLLRVVRKDGFVPEPRWDEQLEGAIGIGWMDSKSYPDYQPDYAVFNAAFAVLGYAEKYNEEKDKLKEGDRGFRYYSARLSEAFENLQRDVAKARARDKDLTAYVTEVARQTTAVLRLIGTGGSVTPGDFEQWLSGHTPKSDTVYKGVADSKVTPGGETAER